jgi:hypothetical protein
MDTVWRTGRAPISFMGGGGYNINITFMYYDRGSKERTEACGRI